MAISADTASGPHLGIKPNFEKASSGRHPDPLDQQKKNQTSSHVYNNHAESAQQQDAEINCLAEGRSASNSSLGAHHRKSFSSIKSQNAPNKKGNSLK